MGLAREATASARRRPPPRPRSCLGSAARTNHPTDVDHVVDQQHTIGGHLPPAASPGARRRPGDGSRTLRPVTPARPSRTSRRRPGCAQLPDDEQSQPRAARGRPGGEPAEQPGSHRLGHAGARVPTRISTPPTSVALASTWTGEAPCRTALPSRFSSAWASRSWSALTLSAAGTSVTISAAGCARLTTVIAWLRTSRTPTDSTRISSAFASSRAAVNRSSTRRRNRPVLLTIAPISSLRSSAESSSRCLDRMSAEPPSTPMGVRRLAGGHRQELRLVVRRLPELLVEDLELAVGPRDGLRLPLLLQPSSLGAVTRDLGEPDVLPCLVVHGGDQHGGPEPGPVLADAPALLLVVADPQRHLELVLRVLPAWTSGG